MDQFSIYLQKELKVIVHARKGKLQEPVLATALKKLENLGYTLSADLIGLLQTWEKRQFVSWFERLMDELMEITGMNYADHFKPMYPGFPDQVMNIQDSQLYLNALLHYFTLQLPETSGEQQRILLLDQLQLRIIEQGSEEEFQQLARNMLQSKTALSLSGREQLQWLAADYKQWEYIIPEKIPVKETAAVFLASLLAAGRASESLIAEHVHTVTDILRLACALSDGDVSLAEGTRFRSFKRAERRLLLSLLEGIPNPLEDLFRYQMRWIRLGERLHPGEYKDGYPKSAACFDRLRADDKPATFYSRVEHSLMEKNLSEAMELLGTRPGELARRLDELIRKGADLSELEQHYAAAVKEVSTPVLLSVLAHFQKRMEVTIRRHFFPKGNTASLYTKSEVLEPLPDDAAIMILHHTEAALVQRFSELPPLGKVYIDEDLKRFPVPWGLRSASKALYTLPRASRVPLDPGETVRFFLWWKEGLAGGRATGRVDIDLSSVLYSHNWSYLGHTSYTQLKSDVYQAAHSGDIVTAPDGAAEYIDLHLPSMRKHGVRYVVMTLNSFTSHAFKDLPECYGGWMMRQIPQSGQVFEPSTIQNRFDISADAQICIPVILDLWMSEVIWCDLSLTKFPNAYNNVESNKMGLAMMGQAMSELVRPDLYSLFKLHVKARGMETDDPKAANIRFSASLERHLVEPESENEGLAEKAQTAQIITPLNQEQIAAEFM
ncbi:cytoplasmic protein [Neobacillus mesonae]|nr:cytoplasmic protein [Neobacillus mesonae]